VLYSWCQFNSRFSSDFQHSYYLVYPIHIFFRLADRFGNHHLVRDNSANDPAPVAAPPLRPISHHIDFLNLQHKLLQPFIIGPFMPFYMSTFLWISYNYKLSETLGSPYPVPFIMESKRNPFDWYTYITLCLPRFRYIPFF